MPDCMVLLKYTASRMCTLQVYIIGEVGIEEELDLIGVPHLGGPGDKGKTIELKSGYALPHDHDVGGESFATLNISADHLVCCDLGFASL